MIPAAGIQDQELPIAAKRARVNNPTVAWRGNLRARPAGDGESLLGSSEAVGTTELADFHAVHRQAQMPAGGGKRNGGSEATGGVERGEGGPSLLAPPGGPRPAV